MESKKPTVLLSLIFCLGVALTPFAMAKSKSSSAPAGQKVFEQNCASCHAGGGNTVKPGKPVIGSTKLATLATFKAYLENPVGHMPYYKHVVTDPKVLRALYQYCTKLKPAKAA